LGGIAVALVGGGSVVAYALALRWIRAGAQVEEKETYAYPTPALHQHETEG
jgi:Flp pilus assembly pilin Flp